MNIRDEEGFDVKDGIIRNPGKFEGEPRWVPHFWERLMDGGADGHSANDYDGCDYFDIDESDRIMFSELKNVVRVYLWETDSGFVCSHADQV